MKLVTSTSAAVILATLSMGAVAPVLAQEAPVAGANDAPRFEHFRADDQDGSGRDGMRNGMRGGLVQMVCSEEGADRLELMLLAVSQRLDLTAGQTPLYDALKTAALTAQTAFSDTCASVLPSTGATAAPSNPVERLQTRIKIDEARLAALSGVLPSLEAFYNGLTDEQKAKLDIPGEMRREHFGERDDDDNLGERDDDDNRRPGRH